MPKTLIGSHFLVSTENASAIGAATKPRKDARPSDADTMDESEAHRRAFYSGERWRDNRKDGESLTISSDEYLDSVFSVPEPIVSETVIESGNVPATTV
jgi:hypothetical protein